MDAFTRATLDQFRAWLEKEKHKAEEDMREHVREALFRKKLDEGEDLEDPGEVASEEVEVHLYDIEDLDIDDDPGINFTYGYMHALRDVLHRFDKEVNDLG